MKCRGCGYRSVQDDACNFCYFTGEPRGCSARECYEKKIHYAPLGKVKRDAARKGLMPAPHRGPPCKRVVREFGGKTVVYSSAMYAAEAMGVSEDAIRQWARGEENRRDSVWRYE